MTGVWIAVAVMVLLFVVSAVWWFRRSRLSAEELQRRKELREATKHLRSVERAHQKAIKTAEKTLKRTQRDYENRISAAEARLRELRSPTGRRLASYRGVTLFERQVSTPQGGGPLVGARATVDTAGALAMKSRATLARMAAGGVLLGPLGAVLSMGFKKHKEVDKRELYLLVEGHGFAGVVECPADDGLKAREFAARVNSSATQAEDYEARLPGLIAAAEQEVAAARRATGQTDEARRELEAVNKDVNRLDAIAHARQRVAALNEGETSRGELPPHT